jgi:PIN domain nuclease of toxin-antitoxin system
VSYLLDTHLLLWVAADSARVPDEAREIVNDESIDSYFSVASLWEVAMKTGRGRPEFRVDARVLRRGLLESGFPELPIDADHVVAVTDLDSHHRDPFDRLLVAQAKVEGLTLLTADARLADYGSMVRVVA